MENMDGVIVAGAGPVGLITAFKLAQADVPVVVCESNEDVIRSPRAFLYHLPAVEALDSLGLLDEMKEVGLVKDDYQYRTIDGGILASWDFSSLEPGDAKFPFNVHLGQHELALLVLRRLEALPGAEVRWGQRVVDVTQDDEGAEVTVENQAGDRSRLRARWVVGADGAHSAVRRSLGIEFPGYTWPDWLVSMNIRHDFQALGYARSNFHVDPHRWGVVTKITPDGLWRVNYAEEAGLPEAEVRRRVPARHAQIFPGETIPEPEIIAPYRVHDRCAERFWAGRVLLAGDAAHVIIPMGGYGLNGGILDAVDLADALIAVIKGVGDESRLRHYDTERRRVYTEFVAPTARAITQRLSESDPDRQRAARAVMAKLGIDREATRAFLTASYRLLSAPYTA